jgi:hypothetical protein
MEAQVRTKGDGHDEHRQAVGLSQSRPRCWFRVRVDRAVERALRALEDWLIVGTVVLIAKGGDIVYVRAARIANRPLQSLDLLR